MHLERELQHDLMEYVGQKNTPETQLRVAQTIKYYQTKAISSGRNNNYLKISDIQNNPTEITLEIDSSNNYNTSSNKIAALGSHIYTSNSGTSATTATTMSSSSTPTWDTAFSTTGWTDYENMTHRYITGDFDVKFYPLCHGELQHDGILHKKMAIKNNLAVHVKSRVNIINEVPENEAVAIETLRETISETEFRKYIKFGFVLVQGQSGNMYQVFRNKWHTKVWKNGKVIEEVCVRIKSDIKAPPTDNVIAFKTLIETDEEEFKKLGNVYKMSRVA